MPSTVIKKIRYDKQAQILQITFVSGLIYNYKSVPENIYLDLLNSGSRGSYFNLFIKDRYEFERLN